GSTLPFPPDYEHFYSVTEHQQKTDVSGGGTGGAIMGTPLGEDGFTPFLARSPSFKIQSRTVNVDILRCRHCETQIGEKDYGWSEEEIKLYEASEAKKAEMRAYRGEKSDKAMGTVFVLFSIVVISAISTAILSKILHNPIILAAVFISIFLPLMLLASRKTNTEKLRKIGSGLGSVLGVIVVCGGLLLSLFLAIALILDRLGIIDL
ncbi:MAG: hypothetical protein AAEJ46_00500, partial [Planctomycetota bacterium]